MAHDLLIRFDDKLFAVLKSAAEEKKMSLGALVRSCVTLALAPSENVMVTLKVPATEYGKLLKVAGGPEEVKDLFLELAAQSTKKVSLRKDREKKKPVEVAEPGKEDDVYA